MTESHARRFWTYPKDSWNAGRPLSIYPGGDEYGNSTLVLQLPGQRALVAAYNWPLRRELEPCEGTVEWGWVGPEVADPDNPLPIGHFARHEVPPEGCHLVRREVMYGRWERCDDPS